MANDNQNRVYQNFNDDKCSLQLIFIISVEISTTVTVVVVVMATILIISLVQLL